VCAALSRECVGGSVVAHTVRIPKRGEIHEICHSGSEEKTTKFYRNLSHTSRNDYGLEISYGSHSKLWETPSRVNGREPRSVRSSTPVNVNERCLGYRVFGRMHTGWAKLKFSNTVRRAHTSSFVPDLFSPPLEITSLRAHVHVHGGFGSVCRGSSKLAKCMPRFLETCKLELSRENMFALCVQVRGSRAHDRPQKHTSEP
jgi:hypothetical protein